MTRGPLGGRHRHPAGAASCRTCARRRVGTRHAWPRARASHVQRLAHAPSPPRLLQAQADSAGVLMDEQEAAFSLVDLEGAQDARPGPAAGRHTKRRR